jgi:Tol biopolymer transport system component
VKHHDPDASQSEYAETLLRVSTPLAGAGDGANDAAWSPSGKWIAFDRRWIGEPNIYLVPATGGPQQLVRGDAVRADWAPNSKRIVFQQASDESIRTVAAAGGRGQETLIAPNGLDPAWSPDGKWIAYVHDGNIWKVQVNILGRVLGTPIQVTNLSGWNVGAPTWSPDSQTIIFNGGVDDLVDIWKVSAFGGDPVWLSGSPDYGDYGPENARNSSRIAFASVSP